VSEPQLVMTAEELNDFLAAAFEGAPRLYTVEHVDLDGIRMRLPTAHTVIRPGGTLSGPTVMSLADAAAWLVTLSRIGPVAMAVTSHLTIDFLRKPAPLDLLAHARLLRLTSRRSVAEVRLWTEDGTVDEPVAFATVTYSIPPA
jgi:uncharacterized protein (TIGR00369 family)